MIVLTVLPVSGAEQDIAVLIRGPVKIRSFPLIYPNALDVWSGYYRYLEIEIEISFTSNNILIPSEWDSIRCADINGLTPDNESFFYTEDDWSVLIQFPHGESPDCIFINKFITRLRYFLRDYSYEGPPLFPAILEFS
jgi:hypothetical protein